MRYQLNTRIFLGLFLTASFRRFASAACNNNMSRTEGECNIKARSILNSPDSLTSPPSSPECSENFTRVHSIAYVTVPSEEVGKTIGRKIVENKLAACVNIVPTVTSIYEWKGEITEDKEALLMIKTRTSRVEELITFVRENHPYEVCEVITVPIDNGNPPYLKWISDTVPAKK